MSHGSNNKAAFASLARLGLGLILFLGRPQLSAAAQTPSPGTPGPDAPSELPLFRFTTEENTVPNVGVFERCLLILDTNKFTFTQPKQTRVQPDSEQSKVTFLARDFSYSLAVRVIPGPSKMPKSAVEDLQQEVQQRFPQGVILEELSLSADGMSGPAFDTAWVTPASTEFTTRFARIFFPGGWIEVVFSASPENFKLHHHTLSRFLLSFRKTSGDGPVRYQKLVLD